MRRWTLLLLKEPSVTQQRRNEMPISQPIYVAGSVVLLEQVVPDSFRLDILLDVRLPDSVPGQFMLLRPVDAPFLLPRPMSLFGREERESGTSISFFFTAVGSGTRYLSAMRVGKRINVLGPLGRPFSFSNGKDVLLVAGGRGIVPLHYLAQELSGSAGRVRLLYGAGTAEYLYPPVDNFPCETLVSTDDGTAGREGTVVDLLEEVLQGRRMKGEAPSILACGPDPMLEAVVSVSVRNSLACQVCVEARMACGLGICRGCAVSLMSEGGSRYALVCTDGPVFEAEHLKWGC
jgi:dihydroorotate dehydrogenase electron transfer subunit